MTGATMFSGIGAPECAMPWVNWKWCAEIEPFPAAVHAARFPGVTNLGDVTAPDFIDRAKEYGSIDLLVFGSPCQSFSVAGKRLGLDDPRGNLALVALGIVNAVRPRWFVFENVPGLLSSGGGRDFGAFLGLVGDIGYSGAWGVLDARWFGVPQRRRRVFFVGSPGDWRGPAAVLSEFHRLSGHPAPRRAQREDVAGGVGHGTADSGGAIPPVSMCLNAKGGLGRIDAESETFIAHSLRGEGFDASEDGTGRGTPLVPVAFDEDDDIGLHTCECGHEYIGGIKTPCPGCGEFRFGAVTYPPIAFDCKASGQNGFGVGSIASTLRAMGRIDGSGNGGGQLAVAYPIQGGAQHGVAVAIHENQRGELSLNTTTGALSKGGGKPGQGYPAVLAQTVNFRGREGGTQAELGGEVATALRTGGGTSSKAHALTGMAVRRLVPAECEALQGFPRDWTAITYRNKPAADGPRYKAIGNSMAVPVLRYLGERIMAVEAVTA